MTILTRPAPSREIVARFPKKSYWERPTPDLMSCTLVYADIPDDRGSGLATVFRYRKTKRSKWTVEISVYGQVPRMTIAEYRAYCNAIADAAEKIEWPVEAEANDAARSEGH